MNTGCFLPFAGLGSNLLHMIFVHKFAKKYGPIIILTFSKSLKDTLKFDPNVKEVILIENFYKKFFDIFKLSMNLKKLKLKKLYIFKCSLRFYFASKLAGISTYSYPFYKKNNLHLTKEAKSFTMKYLGLDKCETETRLIVDPSLLIETKKTLNKNKKNILIAPSSSGPTTMWGISNFIKLMQKLSAKFDCFFIIAVDSSEREKKIAAEIVKSIGKNNTMLLSDKSISQIMPLITCCQLSICNDTSFQNLSCQLNTNTIILRLDTPSVYSSYSKLQHPILPDGYSEINHNSKANPSLISIEKVFEKALSLLI